MKKIAILIETRGGLIDAVYADHKGLSVLILNWDEVEGAEAGEYAVPVSQIEVDALDAVPADTSEILKKYRKEET
jgi:hypothetical protein